MLLRPYCTCPAAQVGAEHEPINIYNTVNNIQ